LKLLKLGSVRSWVRESVAGTGIVEKFQSLCGTSNDMNIMYKGKVFPSQARCGPEGG